jgi:hypothetical protein
MRKLLALVVVLCAAEVGWAGDKEIHKELEKAGVLLCGEYFYIGPLEGLAERPLRPNIAAFQDVHGTDALLDRVAALSNIEEFSLRFEGSDRPDGRRVGQSELPSEED